MTYHWCLGWHAKDTYVNRIICQSVLVTWWSVDLSWPPFPILGFIGASGVDQILSLALFRYLLGFYFHMSAGEHARWGYANYCQNSIAFYASLSLSRPRLRNLQRHLQANWVCIRDILIVFTERFLSVYARSNSLNFFLKNKSVKTNLLVVLK